MAEGDGRWPDMAARQPAGTCTAVGGGGCNTMEPGPRWGRASTRDHRPTALKKSGLHPSLRQGCDELRDGIDASEMGFAWA